MTSRIRSCPLGNGLYRAVDGIDLIVARSLAAAILMIILKYNFLGVGRQALPGAKAIP